jgi:hypothetical protein
MSETSKFYDLASLAEASYVHFDEVIDFSSKAVEGALQNGKLKGTFSATQAADFVTHWQVVSHQKNTDNGFSATLFKNKDTGEYVYATRGTEPGNFIPDILSADYGDIVVDGGNHRVKPTNFKNLAFF